MDNEFSDNEMLLITRLSDEFAELAWTRYFQAYPIEIFERLVRYCFVNKIENKYCDILRNIIKHLDDGGSRKSSIYESLFETLD